MGVVEVSIWGGRADLRLNRPEVLNAVSWEVFEALPRAVAEVAASDARVCVVTGAGRSFCSGIDINTLAAQTGSPEELIATAQAGYRALAALPIPTIASVQGHALGAGLQLALACDLRIVATDASLGLLELDFGIVPDLGGSTGLPRLVGRGRAKKMIWLRERIDGVEAERIGLAEVAVEAGELDAVTDRLAEALAEAPAVAVRAAKALIDLGLLVDVGAGMDAEAEAQIGCMTDVGFAEALAAGVTERASREG